MTATTTPLASVQAGYAPFVHVWTLRDGKVVRFRQLTDTVLVRAAMQA